MGMPRCQEKQIRNLPLRIRQASRSTCRGAILFQPPHPPPAACPSRQLHPPPAAPGGWGRAKAAPAPPPAAPANLPPYGNGPLPPGIRSRRIADVNGLTVHILEAGYESPGRPAVLLLHGFPELAYSWRKVMLPLAAAEYHVIAPDQRGYGRTTGWDHSHAAHPRPLPILNMTRDAIGLVYA